MSSAVLRPLSIGEILDTSFQLYRRYFVTLATIGVLCTAIPLMLDVYIEASGGRLANLGMALFSAVLLMALNSVATAATVFVVSEGYLGREVGARDALHLAAPFAGRLILAQLAYSLLAFVGTLLFIVPGLIVLVGMSLTPPSLVVENLSSTAALGRSWRLTKGARWKLVGIFIPLFLILVVPMIAITVLVGVVAGLLGLGSPSDSGGTAAVLGAAFAGLVQMLVYPLFNCALTVAYYDQRIRKEGFDLELLASRLRAA
ncbi:MAG TPA: hypothetical protein VHJ69_11350 [Gemmatimonadales bacterium]|jgi:hypothetical protein|nr:hypothetical protein [Gemmatimonadales bacterium]